MRRLLRWIRNLVAIALLAVAVLAGVLAYNTCPPMAATKPRR